MQQQCSIIGTCFQITLPVSGCNSLTTMAMLPDLVMSVLSSTSSEKNEFFSSLASASIK